MMDAASCKQVASSTDVAKNVIATTNEVSDGTIKNGTKEPSSFISMSSSIPPLSLALDSRRR